MENIFNLIIYGSKDDIIEIYKNENKNVLGITSVWLLIPVINGILSNEFHKNILSIHILLCCIFSILWWKNPKSFTFLQKLDKHCANTLFIHVLYYINEYSRYLIVFFTVFSFIYTEKLRRKNYIVHSIWSHLLFRYFSFICCYKETNINYENLKENSIMLITGNYFINIIILIETYNPNYNYYVLIFYNTLFVIITNVLLFFL